MSPISAKVYDPVQEAQEFQEKLSTNSRKLGFFIGAGSSMAVGVDGIWELTANVGKSLQSPFDSHYDRMLAELGENATVETILNRVRLYKELLMDGPGKTIDGLDADVVTQLDQAICEGIYERLNIEPPKGLAPQIIFARWLRSVRKDAPVEVFTTNYDLLYERAMEDQRVPYFDGFVGAVSPFFTPESVEADGSAQSSEVCPPRAWVRLWKVHGSIGWRAQVEPSTGKRTIIRQFGSHPFKGDELVIYPSRDKYMDSRKLPFISYLDRLSRFVGDGETMVVVSGYSFGDEHLNDILFQGLRSNQRLHVVALMFGRLTEEIATFGERYHNLSIYAADAACVGGIRGAWQPPKRKRTASESWPFWNETDNLFTLGDFLRFADFLQLTMGHIVERDYRPVLPPPTAESEMEDR